MSWLRLDDGFADHPKILALGTPARRWTWLQILIYTCRYDSPIVRDDVGEVVRGATGAYLSDCWRIGLLDRDDDGLMRVHDWDEYNGRVAEERAKNAERKRKQRGTRVGHDRDIDVTETGHGWDESETHARAGARGPSPSPSPSSPRTSSVGPARDDDDDDLLTALNELEPSDTQRLRWTVALNRDRELVRRQLGAALTFGTKPAAYLDSLILRGDDPGVEPPSAHTAEVERAPIDPEVEAAALRELAALGSFRSRADELREIAAKRGSDDDD